MAKATAVIGANFGDEGKGRTVDYLAAQTPGSLVVRFNGGAQAGHTVEADGKRHVFSHFGSGTLAGAPTVLSRFFVASPTIFVMEQKELHNLGVHSPDVFVDTRCPLTTPYEVAVNRAVERARGDARHGSCGVGFGETWAREEFCSFRFGTWPDSLEGPREFARVRLAALGIDSVEPLKDADAAVPFWRECFSFMRKQTVHLRDTASLLRSTPSVVFEGAQGLLLDANNTTFFPHVTRSRTGLHNVKVLLGEAGIDELRAIYVTRSYLTRHGAGPLPGEDPNLSFPDETNVPGEFQGSLRFAPLDVGLLARTVHADLSDNPKGIGISGSLAVTCLDQFGGLMYAHHIEESVGLPVRYVGFGAKREKLYDRTKTVLPPTHLTSALAARM